MLIEINALPKQTQNWFDIVSNETVFLTNQGKIKKVLIDYDAYQAMQSNKTQNLLDVIMQYQPIDDLEFDFDFQSVRNNSLPRDIGFD